MNDANSLRGECARRSYASMAMILAVAMIPTVIMIPALAMIPAVIIFVEAVLFQQFVEQACNFVVVHVGEGNMRAS